jgi:hypothetical protein
MFFNTMTETTAKVKRSRLKGREVRVCDLDHSTETVNGLPQTHSAKHGSYVVANARKRTATAVRTHVNERLVPETGATGIVDDGVANNGRETPQAEKPWPAEFGWDFPFDFPKPGR